MIDLQRLREATEDDVDAALAGRFIVEHFADTERAALLEVFNRMRDHLVEPRDD